ncbi:MAG: translation initiation factor [Planctomycetota bacterium]|jgi:translation initiation factor 1|nr:translation initiation factor [Planctomycetota bacterium]
MSKRKLTRGEGWSFEPAVGRADGQPAAPPPPSRQRVKIAIDKRAKGKIVTVVSGIALPPGDIKKLAKDLKNARGSGGSAGIDHIEIQGDHRDAIRSRLSFLGWTVLP